MLSALGLTRRIARCGQRFLKSLHYSYLCFTLDSATLSFVTTLAGKKIDLLLYLFVEPFSTTTLMGDYCVVRRVFKSRT